MLQNVDHQQPPLTNNNVVSLHLFVVFIHHHHNANIICKQVNAIVARHSYSNLEFAREELAAINWLRRVVEVGSKLVECTICSHFGVLLWKSVSKKQFVRLPRQIVVNYQQAAIKNEVELWQATAAIRVQKSANQLIS